MKILRRLAALLALAAVAWGLEPLDLQARIDELSVEQGGAIHISAGYWSLPGPVNVRGRRHVRITTDGPATVLIANDWTGPPAPMLDFTDSYRCFIEPCLIRSRYCVPSCAILLARSAPDHGAGRHIFTGVRIEGTFTVAPVVALGSECNNWIGCEFVQSEPGGHCYVTGYANEWNVTSPFGPVGGGSNLVHNFDGCIFALYVQEAIGTECNLVLGAHTRNVNLRGCTFSNRQAGQVTRAAILMGSDALPYPVTKVIISGCDFECESARNVAFITGSGASNIYAQACDFRSREASWSGLEMLTGYERQGCTYLRTGMPVPAPVPAPTPTPGE